MSELYDALEQCLEAMERGASLDRALSRYPKLAAGLRPLLEASLMARSSSRVHVPPEVRKRGRVRVLQQVHESRESRIPGRRRMIPTFPRIAITATLAAALLFASTGLVSASSGALPGQNLYPVKRTWESVRLLFVFSPEQRDLLQSNYQQERVDEIYEMLGRRMTAPISFSGLLAKRADGHWVVSGIPVTVDSTTALPSVPINEGAPVSVTGTTGADGVVQAQQIQVLLPGASLPPLEPSDDNEHPGLAPTQESGSAPTQAVPVPTQGGQPGSQPEHITYQFSGVVQSMQGSIWRINGQTVYVDGAQTTGQVTLGSIVQFQGYYASDGRFIVLSIQARAGSSDNKQGKGGSGSGDGGDSEGGDDGP